MQAPPSRELKVIVSVLAGFLFFRRNIVAAKPQQATGDDVAGLVVVRGGGEHYMHPICAFLPKKRSGFLAISDWLSSQKASHKKLHQASAAIAAERTV
jgi:hypothetical protein